MPRPRRSRSVRAFPLVAALALVATGAGCTQPAPPLPADPVSRSSDPYPLGPGCDAQPDPHCDNPVSRVLVPMLRGSSFAIADDAPSELCRRLAFDLIGRLPTMDEFALCAHETPTQTADRYLAMPDYTRNQRRNWGERFYDLDDQWYLSVVELDQLVEKLFREQISYPDFIAQFIVHPGFYARYQGDDWASNVVRVALNRAARADEIDGLRPLHNVWASRRYCDGIIWHNALDDGREPADADGACGRNEWAVNYCHCSDGNGHSTCVSNTYGTLVDFGADGCVDPMHGDDDVNLLRETDAAAGRVPVCPDGPNVPSCGDRTTPAMGQMGWGGQLSRLGQISGAQRDRLLALGHVLAARPDFYEGAVDREMRRFLSWWQNGLRHPDYDLPGVRAALATLLRTTGSLRAVQRAIVTSVLYTQPAEVPASMAAAASTMPVWAFGPTRVLTSERWLDAAAIVAYDTPIGWCDFRFVATNNNWSTLTDRRLIEPGPALVMGFMADDYHDAAQALGGCASTLARPVTSTLAIASAQNSLAKQFCANGTAVLPPGFAGAAGGDQVALGVRWLYLRALGREPAADELSMALGETAQCLADSAASMGSDGCGNNEQAVRWMCERLLDSGEFAIY